MIPTVDFCGLTVSRLIIGANPFGGFSHQSKARNAEMAEWHTPERIVETWHRAEAAGINTMIANNETPRVVQTVSDYLATGGELQWIAQVNNRTYPDMGDSVKNVVDIGCSALYFHGAKIDGLYAEQDEKTLRIWFDKARLHGVPVGVAGHSPGAHLWVNSLGVADFHAFAFFNCGSLHDGLGLKFELRDLPDSAAAIRAIEKPIIGYKIMAAGRIDPRMAFEYAFDTLKPTDVVNVGMHRGDKDDMVEENASIVTEILARQQATA